MIIKQLSVFLENKSGRLSDVANILGENQINMSAFSVADSSDFGILRAIVSDPQKALSVLKAANFSASLTEVVCISVPNEPGAMGKALNVLKEEQVQIEYLYAFSMGDKASVVIRPAQIEFCIEMLQKHKLELLRASSLYEI
jgi:hypothetical protein